MTPPSSRMTKNRAQPTRYRPGKAEIDDPQSEEDSESNNEDDAKAVRAKQPPPKVTSFPTQKKLGIDLSKADQQRSIAASAPQYKKQEDDLEGFVTASESSEEGSQSGSEDSDEDSSEEDTDSSEEPQKPLLRPTFISKAKRVDQASHDAQSERRKSLEEEQLRKEKTDALLQAQIERDAAARAAGKKYWDDEDVAPEDDIDDTDGLDPDAEHAAWKLRELKRIRRDRLALVEKEKEREEIERRRNMTAEEREAEDAAYIAEQTEARENRGKMGYMQKYFHRGAYFNDDDQDEDVKKALNRDLAGAKFTDSTGDKAVLPEYMRIRDMTRLGKTGRTKYKDLRSEDTGTWGRYDSKKRENSDLDERFQPDAGAAATEGQRTGANSAPIGTRRKFEGDSLPDRGEKRARYD